MSGEADHTLWLRPADALAGELTMLPPTMVTLAEVAAAGDLAEWRGMRRSAIRVRRSCRTSRGWTAPSPASCCADLRLRC